ncbi:MAG: hypothetical protein ACRC14_17085 [Paracoccaceae bacterium]
MTRLEGVHYRPVPHLPLAERQGSAAANAVVGDLIGAEIATTLAAHDSPQVDFAICVSTVMDMPFVAGYLDWSAIAARISRHTDVVPRNFTASYECAGWGFALDYARRRLPQGGRVLLVIVDLNVLDISFWRGNDAWGQSGFGVATVLLDLPATAEVRLSVKVAKSSLGMGEFCADLREWLKTSTAAKANAPFLPEGMAGIYGHFLPPDRLLPNLHARWGHAFGSDTWLSFIDGWEQGLLQPGAVHCATSASLRGYWAICDLTLAGDVRMSLRPVVPVLDLRVAA